MCIRDKKESSRGEADAWEQGCAQDSIRNNFIIPLLAKLVEVERPHRILDLGTGTAYISRKIDERISYRPEWIGLDRNPERLKLANSLKSPEMKFQSVLADIDDDIAHFSSIDLVLVIFTLLELPNPSSTIRSISTLLGSGGMLVIALPDVWRDAFEMNGRTSGSLDALLEGGIDLAKVDKFTGRPYPFYAKRIEHLIANVLGCSFALEALRQGGNAGDVFLLAFRKLGDTSFLQNCDAE